jgi:LPS-assembly protein
MHGAAIFLCSLAIALPAFAAERDGCGAGANDSDTACATAAAQPLAAPVLRFESDWVPRSELPEPTAARLPEYCSGAYVEPPFGTPLDVDPATLPIEASADGLQYWLGDRAELHGGVTVTRGNQSLRMTDATFNASSRTVQTEDGVLLREPGLLVFGAEGEVALGTGAATVTNAQFELQHKHLRGTARMLERTDVGDLIARRAEITRCEPGNGNWMLGGREVRIDNGAKFGTARDAVLRVRSVPVLWTPFIRFPVTDERMTGWLFPEFGYSNKDGTDIAAPYYLNLAPNYDATVTPRYISDRGAGVEGDFNHLSRYGRSELGGAYLPHDDIYNGEYSRDEFDSLGLPGNFDPADRWLILARQSAKFGNFSTLVDYTHVSDLDYFRDLGTNLSVASQVDLMQFGQLRYKRGNASLRLWAQDLQPLDDNGLKPYRRLPAADFTYSANPAGPLTWSLATSWADFDRPNGSLTGIDRINGSRLDVAPRLLLSFDNAYRFVRVATGYRYTDYDLQDVPVGADEHPNRSIAMASLDTGLRFERDLGSDAVQTLEPRLFYLYQQYKNQSELPEFDVTELSFTFDQLFRTNRFTGLDRIADANQLTAALTSRITDRSTGAQRLRASVGQIVYFEDRQVTLTGTSGSIDDHTRSPLAGAFEVRLLGGFSLLSGATYDPNGSDWDQVAASLRYRPDPRHIFDVSYRRRTDMEPVVKQSDVSAYWSVASNWSVIGHFAYDLEQKRTIDTMAGLEYSDCCWQVRLVGRQYLTQPGNVQTDDPKTDEGIYFQIVFKGLAGLGNKIDSLMQNGIPGYRAEAY